jgi:hypothetical protein
MKIGVLADSADACARELAAQIGSLSGQPCPLFDFSASAKVRVEMDQAGIAWDGQKLDEFDKILVAGFDYQEPLIPRAVASADWSVWQIDYIVDEQHWSFVSSVLRDLERRGVRLINPWGALQFGFAKARLLAELKRAGFLVPNWLCSNEMPVVQKFCEEQKRVVWRPNTGRAMWQLFLDKQRLHCVDPAKPPVLVASHPEQALMRAFVCDGEVLLALNCSAPHMENFERMEEVWACDCGAVADELVRAVGRIGAVWAQVLFVEQDGKPCIYDIDVDPRYGWLPAEFRAYLQIRLARKILGMPSPGNDALPVPDRAERDSLFMRRMLVTLHELESTKYSEDAPQD